MAKAAGYVRLSKYDDATTSLARQREAIEKLCADRGWELAETFEDVDRSGWNGVHRPGLDRMLASLDGVGALVVYRIDRLARSQADFARILETLRDAGVDFVATDLQVDSSPAGTLVRDLVARLAQFESDQISVRSKAMMAYKAKKGEPVGRVPYGWRRNGKTYEPDPEQQAALREAAARFIAGETFSAIAPGVGLPVASLSRILRSQRVLDALPPELSGPLAQALRDRRWQRVPTSKQSLLGGIARCAECGTTMTKVSTRGGRKNGRWYSYACRDSHAAISGQWLDAYVTREVLDAADTGRLLTALKKRRKVKTPRRVSEIEARLELLEHDHYVTGKIPAARFERLRDALLDQLKAAQKVERDADVDLPAELARDLGERWGDLSIGTRRRIVRACLEGIEVEKAKGHGRVDPGRVRLVWRVWR
jgi:DNA invertase Pin-like site-specific DNA recombinase